MVAEGQRIPLDPNNPAHRGMIARYNQILTRSSGGSNATAVQGSSFFGLDFSWGTSMDFGSVTDFLGGLSNDVASATNGFLSRLGLGSTPPNDGVTRTFPQVTAYNQAWTDLQDPNIRAFLNTLAFYESRNRYNVRYDGTVSGGRIDDLSGHPNVPVTLQDGRTTTAAGAYQFTNQTWDDFAVGKLALPDFSPRSQDLAAALLLRSTGATESILKGDISTAIRQAGEQRWEAFRVNSSASITDRYNSFLKRK
jgi:muramidase (phage lysozyme)